MHQPVLFVPKRQGISPAAKKKKTQLHIDFNRLHLPCLNGEISIIFTEAFTFGARHFP